MDITQQRDRLTPYEYPQAMQFYRLQQQGRWEADEIRYEKDIVQWPSLDPEIKSIVGKILRGFVQTESVVGDYWSSKVSRWFPKPEICLMARRFADMEGVHALSYNQLSEVLGLDTYSAYMRDPIASARLGYLIDTDSEAISDRLLSLALFSSLVEGTILYSSFVILLWLKTQNLLPGVTNVIEYSIRDEGLHSDAGSWLYRTLAAESGLSAPVDRVIALYDNALAIEDTFIDHTLGALDKAGLSSYKLKNYLRARANERLGTIDIHTKFTYDPAAAREVSQWFDSLAHVTSETDNFARKSTAYSKGAFQIDLSAIKF